MASDDEAVTGLAQSLAGRQPRARLAVVLIAGLAVAVVHALQQGQWMVGGVLAFGGLAAVLCPVADAAISWRSEFVADRFAVEHGLALELAAALRAMDDGQGATSGWARRLLASHPAPNQRVTSLVTAAGVGGTVWPQTGQITSRRGPTRQSTGRCYAGPDSHGHGIH